ncbi:MAG: hypothetical protein NTW75_15660 [Planctomycetales bacterium]|nr:hypothetical protein [Planctomycetales bacterium]
MSQELLYTSAPRGLKPGSRGFCTVLSTQGMPAPLATALEGLSGYRLISTAGDKGANRNPIVYSHLILPAGGRTLNVLSRIAEFGLDYSQRANKLAHHVVLDKTELLPGGPANLLSMPDFMREQWQGEPKVVAFKPVKREGRLPSGPCRAWEERTGDAGWAGVLAESFLRDPERLVFLMFAPGQEILPLFAEALSLLPVERRWNVTFSTYFTGLVPGTTCVWRAMVYDSKEAHESLRFVQALRVDLTSGSLGPARGGTLVEAARTGVRPHDAKPRTAPPIGPAEEESVELEDAQVEFATDEHPAAETHFVGIPQLPLQRALGPNTRPTAAASQSRSGRRLADVIEAESRRWLWITLSTVVLLIATFLGIVFRDGLGRPEKSPKVAAKGDLPANAAAANKKAEDERQIAATKKKADEDAAIKKKADEDAAIKKKADEDAAAKKKADEDAAIKKKADEDAAAKKKADEDAAIKKKFVSTPDIEGKVTIASFGPAQWPANNPTYNELYDLSKNWNQAEVPGRFRDRFTRTPPTNVLLVPSWLPWITRRPDEANDDDKTLLQIVDRGQKNDSFASINLILPTSNDPEYRLKRSKAEAGKMLAWCAIEVRETDASSRPIMRLFLHDPSKVPKPKLSLKDNQPVWQTNLPFDNVPPSMLLIEEIAIQFGEKRCPTTFDKWNVVSQIKPADTSLPIEGITEYLNQHTTEKFTQRPQLLIEAKNEKGILHLKARLSGVFGAHGLVGDIDNKLDSERKKIWVFDREVPNTPNAEELPLQELLKEIDSIQGSLFSRSFEEDSIGKLNESIESFLKNTLAKLQAAAKGDKKKVETLNQLDQPLKALPEKLESLLKRHQKFTALSKELDEAQIVTVRISYELFEDTDTERKKKSIKAYIVNFPDGNNPGDPKTKGAN